MAVAYPGEANASTFAALALSFLGLAGAIPTLVSAFFSGALADRYDRKQLMRWVNVLALLATVGIGATLAFQPSNAIPFPGASGFYLPLWVLLLFPLWAAVTVSSTLFRPAFNASVPRFASPSELGVANGLIYSSAAIFAVGAQFTAGAVATGSTLALGLIVPFALLAVGQLCLNDLRIDLAPPKQSAYTSVSASAAEGFRYLWRHKALLEITISALVINFLGAMAFVELGLYVVDWLSLGAAIWVGIITAGATAGSALGTLLVGRISFERNAGRWMIGLTVLEGGMVAALAFTHSIWFAFPIVFAYGIVPGMFLTIFLSTIQATVPDETMGRVFAADEVGSYAMVPPGQFLGGLVTAAVGVGATFLLAGAGIILLGIVMLGLFGSLRRLSFHPRSGVPVASDSPLGAANPVELAP